MPRQSREKTSGTFSAAMKIAPAVEDADWKRLNLDRPESPDWDQGIGILERRLCSRFTDVVDFLIAEDEKRSAENRRFGFVILAIDCLVVETLEAFRRGLTDTRRQSQELCTDFLSQRPSFNPFFTKDLATRFYKEFRCGIAHNAQVFGTGRVWSVGPLVALHQNRITVNRTAFHHAVKQELAAYLQELRDPANTELRENFRTKMDFIAEGKFQP